MAGGCFFIKSQMNGLVMDVEGGGVHPGTKVIMWHQKHSDNDNQIFYEDPMTGTIRNKKSQLCLDLQGERVVVNHYQPGNMNQQWMVAADRVQSRVTRGSVMDIANQDSAPGAAVCAWSYNGGRNQQWRFEPVHGVQPPHFPGYPQPSAPPVGVRHYYYIKSVMNSLVLDVQGGGRHPGTKLVMWHQKRGSDAANQLFYEDYMTGTIRSKMTELCIDIQGDSLVMNHYQPGNTNQQWMFAGDRVQNRTNPNSVFDIANNNANPGAKVGAWSYNGGRNQQWRLESA